MTMKKISVVLVLLLSTIVLVTACGDKKTKTESSTKTAKSKVSKSASEATNTSVSSSSSQTSSQSAAKQEDIPSHGGATEESQWSKDSSEAAKVMTVAEGRDALRQVGIDDSNFSNADINKYILEAQAAGLALGNYMKSQGF